MVSRDDNHRDPKGNLPGPQEDPDTGITGTTDERSSENRRKGLEKDLDTTADETITNETKADGDAHEQDEA